MTRPINAAMVRETSTTTGTGTYNLAGAVTGFRNFVAGVGDGKTCYYFASDGTDWEHGIGTITDAATDTLARTLILASSNAGAAVNWGAGTRTLRCGQSPLGIFPTGHICDLTLSNDATDAVNDIVIAAGSARSDDDTVDMVLQSSLIKRIDAAWAVGTNQGGMNTGSVADSTWYEVLLIMRTDTGVVDVMFSTTANRATLPTNYTKKRRIGWVRRGSATNLAFTQVGDYFTLTTQVNDVSATVTTTATQVTLTAPPSTVARFRASLVAGTLGTDLNDQVIVFSEIAEGNVTPAMGTGISSLAVREAGALAHHAAAHFELLLNSSSQIEWDGSANANTAAATFDISTYGWIDFRGRTASP